MPQPTRKQVSEKRDLTGKSLYESEPRSEQNQKLIHIARPLPRIFAGHHDCTCCAGTYYFAGGILCVGAWPVDYAGAYQRCCSWRSDSDERNAGRTGGHPCRISDGLYRDEMGRCALSRMDGMAHDPRFANSISIITNIRPTPRQRRLPGRFRCYFAEPEIHRVLHCICAAICGCVAACHPAISADDRDLCRAWRDQCPRLRPVGCAPAWPADTPRRNGMAAAGRRCGVDRSCRLYADAATGCLKQLQPETFTA